MKSIRNISKDKLSACDECSQKVHLAKNANIVSENSDVKTTFNYLDISDIEFNSLSKDLQSAILSIDSRFYFDNNE